MADRLDGIVAAEGLAAFRRDLRRIDVELAKEVPAALKQAAELVAEEARRRAVVGSRPIPRTRRPRKRMRDTVRPFARGTVAGVRVSVVNTSGGKSYAYPRRVEYGNGGSRAFLRPALRAKQREVLEDVSKVLDHVADTWKGTR